MFLCDFNFINEYFKKQGNFMTEEEEIQLEKERGLLDKEAEKKYQQYLRDKQNKQEEQEKQDSDLTALRK